MKKSAYIAMTCEIAQEWLAQVYEGYPYETDDNGNVSYTDEAQEVFNGILDDVQNTVARYLEVTL